jgi:molybdopterin converting factor subunit 1
MKIKVVLFAVARDMIDKNSVALELSDSATVSDLKRALVNQYPNLEEIVLRSAFSVNHEYALDQTKLTENVEVALIPPVSGG